MFPYYYFVFPVSGSFLSFVGFFIGLGFILAFAFAALRIIIFPIVSWACKAFFAWINKHTHLLHSAAFSIAWIWAISNGFVYSYWAILFVFTVAFLFACTVMFALQILSDNRLKFFGLSHNEPLFDRNRRYEQYA